jgi:hypothetical protein
VPGRSGRGVGGGEELERSSRRGLAVGDCGERRVGGAAQVVGGQELLGGGLRGTGAGQAQPPAPPHEVSGIEERIGRRRERLAARGPVDAVGEVEAEGSTPERDRLRADPVSVALTV